MKNILSTLAAAAGLLVLFIGGVIAVILATAWLWAIPVAILIIALRAF